MNSQVVFCTYDSPTSIGGPFSLLGRLLPELRSHGIDCRILALTHFGGTGPLIDQLRKLNFEVNAVNCHDSIYDQVRWILDQLHESPPSVFVPNFVLAGLYAGKWLKQTGCTTVGVIHSDDNFYRAMQDTFVFGRQDFQLTDVVCVSEMLLQQIHADLRKSSTNPCYIAPGVDLPETILPKPLTPFRIAYVGRLVEEQKRISLVTRSLIAACKAIPGCEAWIIGDGPDRNVVEQLIRENSADDSVKLLGKTNPEEVPSILQACHVITLLSDYEGLPIALLEGMASGCVPVCRYMRSGIPQLIKQDATGFIVGEDPNDFVETIRRLNSNRALTQQVSENGTKLVQNNYTHTISVQKWMDLLLSKSSKKPPAPFNLPRRIHLPAAHPDLEATSMRPKKAPPLLSQLRRLRKRLGAIRRRII